MKDTNILTATALACISGTLLFTWATAPHLWWSLTCAFVLLTSVMYLALQSERHENEDEDENA